MAGMKSDYNKQCKHPFGTYVEVQLPCRPSLSLHWAQQKTNRANTNYLIWTLDALLSTIFWRNFWLLVPLSDKLRCWPMLTVNHKSLLSPSGTLIFLKMIYMLIMLLPTPTLAGLQEWLMAQIKPIFSTPHQMELSMQMAFNRNWHWLQPLIWNKIQVWHLSYALVGRCSICCLPRLQGPSHYSLSMGKVSIINT